MKMYARLFSLLSTLCLVQQNVTADVNIRLILDYFTNPGGLNSLGLPCNSTRQCNTYFSFSVNLFPNQGISPYILTSNISYNQNDVYQVTLQGIWSRSISTPTQPIQLSFKFMDADKASSPSNNDAIIAQFFTIVPFNEIPVVYNGTQMLTYSLIPGVLNNMRMQFRIAFGCPMSYYGPACNIFCANSDSIYGHNVCDSNGNKICLADYEGVNCDQRKTTSTAATTTTTTATTATTMTTTTKSTEAAATTTATGFGMFDFKIPFIVVLVVLTPTSITFGIIIIIFCCKKKSSKRENNKLKSEHYEYPSMQTISKSSTYKAQTKTNADIENDCPSLYECPAEYMTMRHADLRNNLALPNVPKQEKEHVHPYENQNGLI